MDHYFSQPPIIIYVTPTTTFTLTTEQLICHTDNGSQTTLSFTFCRDNWANFVNHSDHFLTTNLSPQDTRGVGWRDISHQPPYIELFSQPPVRFVFRSSQNWFEMIVWFVRYPSFDPKHAFSRLQRQINAAGWRTFDLS